MTLQLNNKGTAPKDLPIKSALPHVMIGDYRLWLLDFLIMAEYVLENDDLEPDDPRLVFIERIKAVIQKPGWNKGGKRLQLGEAEYSKDWKPSERGNFFGELMAGIAQPDIATNKFRFHKLAEIEQKRRRAPSDDDTD